MLENEIVNLKSEIEGLQAIRERKIWKLEEIDATFGLGAMTLSDEVSTRKIKNDKMDRYIMATDKVKEEIDLLDAEIKRLQDKDEEIQRIYKKLQGANKDVFFQMYFRGLSPKETAVRLSYSRSYIYDLARKTKQKYQNVK